MLSSFAFSQCFHQSGIFRESNAFPEFDYEGNAIEFTVLTFPMRTTWVNRHLVDLAKNPSLNLREKRRQSQLSLDLFQQVKLNAFQKETY